MILLLAFLREIIEMENRKRKKYQADLFSPEVIRSRLSAKKKLEADIDSHVEFLRSVDLNEVENVKEDEALAILSAKLTFNGLSVLKLAMSHVPCTYTMRCREFQRFPLRTVLIHKIFTACCSSRSLDSLVDVHLYVSFLEKHCTEFLSSPEVLPHDKLWKLCENGGYYYTKCLSPPLKSCLNCGEGITMHNPPSKAKLFTLKGPIPASKITLECKGCKISYGITKFTDSTGAHFYPKSISSEVIEMTNASYMTEELYRWIPSLSNHSWVSFSGFSESYNEVYCKEIDRFSNTFSPDKDDSADTDNDEEDDPDSSSTGVMINGELSAKLAAKSYWKNELEEELNDLGIREKWCFSKSSALPYSGSEEDALEYVESRRSEQLYAHTCSKLCSDKGCGRLFVADGNWKLRYAHCMWKVPVSVPGFGNANYPCICPISPRRGHAFCEKHCKMAQAAGYPSELRPFLKKCGVPDADKFAEMEETALEIADQEMGETALEIADQDNPGPSSVDNSSDSCIEANLQICAENCISTDDKNASSYQGTAEFLQSNPDFIDSEEQEQKVECNKDTGGRKTLHCWSRGIFFIVSAGGHIEYWQPLYRSESPTQAFLILAVWLYRRFKTQQDAGKPLAEIERTMQSTVLAYDNMCHVDSLKISKKNLPFPEPFDKAWHLVTKVIDRLHLRNHKNQKCKTVYNPDGKIPSEFNTMSCEQTFVWASRMKKIICAMTRLHQFFFIHRSVKRRNKYTELCHVRNKTPVLPKVPLFKAML